MISRASRGKFVDQFEIFPIKPYKKNYLYTKNVDFIKNYVIHKNASSFFLFLIGRMRVWSISCSLKLHQHRWMNLRRWDNVDEWKSVQRPKYVLFRMMLFRQLVQLCRPLDCTRTIDATRNRNKSIGHLFPININ